MVELDFASPPPNQPPTHTCGSFTLILLWLVVSIIPGRLLKCKLWKAIIANLTKKKKKKKESKG